MGPVRILRMPETELRVGGRGDPGPGLGQVPRLPSNQVEAQRRRVDDDETVAAVGGVDGQGAQALDLQRHVEPVGEAGDVADGDPFGLAVAAGRRDLDDAARRLQTKAGLRLGHGEEPGVEQHGGDADRVGAGHRRGVHRLHDDEAHGGPRVQGRDQQVDVAEDPAARLVEQEVPQGPVLGDPARLGPEGLARRRRDAADHDVADLALGMAADHVNRLAGAHRPRSRLPRPTSSCLEHRRGRRQGPGQSRGRRDLAKPLAETLGREPLSGPVPASQKGHRRPLDPRGSGPISSFRETGRR